jgi:hypothetical protein
MGSQGEQIRGSVGAGGGLGPVLGRPRLGQGCAERRYGVAIVTAALLVAALIGGCEGGGADTSAGTDAAASDGGGGGGGDGGDAFVLPDIDDLAGCKVHVGDVGADGPADLSALVDVCTIEGDVFLTGSPAAPLDDVALGRLGNVRVIRGSLTIEGVAAKGLEGLARLGEVEGDVHITACHHLETLAGLAALETVGHDLIVRENDALVALATPALKTIASGLLVQANSALESLAGLDAVAELGNTARVVGNNALLDLDGLDGLRLIGPGGLVIADNQRLTTLAALERLERAGDKLEIYGNRDLVKVSGIFELRGARRLAVYDNPNLEAIDGFPKLQEVDRVEIHHNPKLAVINGMPAAAKLVELSVHHNNSLAKLVAFGGTIDAGAVTLSDNDVLTQISLVKLNHVGTLTLERNASLANLSGFFPTKYVDILHICDNAKLPPYAVETFIKQLYKPPVTVDDCASP